MSVEAFHKYCDGKGATLTLVRSEANSIAAAYTQVPWGSSYGDKADSTAMLMSLSGDMRVFRPGCPDKAVHHHSDWGPYF